MPAFILIMILLICVIALVLSFGVWLADQNKNGFKLILGSCIIGIVSIIWLSVGSEQQKFNMGYYKVEQVKALDEKTVSFIVVTKAKESVIIEIKDDKVKSDSIIEVTYYDVHSIRGNLLWQSCYVTQVINTDDSRYQECLDKVREVVIE